RRTVLREFEIKRRMSLTPVCCSSASERCPRASASSRVRASSCFFNSISELGPLLTRALAFVPVERSLRPRVSLFAPLRDKATPDGTQTFLATDVLKYITAGSAVCQPFAPAVCGARTGSVGWGGYFLARRPRVRVEPSILERREAHGRC